MKFSLPHPVGSCIRLVVKLLVPLTWIAVGGCADPGPSIMDRVASTRKQADQTLKGRAEKDPIWETVRGQTLSQLDTATEESLRRPILASATEWRFSDGRLAVSVSWIEATPTATHVVFRRFANSTASQSVPISADDLTLAKDAARTVVLYGAVVPVPADMVDNFLKGENLEVQLASPGYSEQKSVVVLRFLEQDTDK